MSMNYSSIIPALLSTALFMFGNGYLITFISIRMSELGHSEQVIGIVASAYYIGLVLGALQIAKFIKLLGHIRVFIIFIGLFNCVCLAHAISDNIYLWFILRLLAGISLAGFYVTIESWLLECCTNYNRGVTLALYMVAISSAQAFGQLLLEKYNGSSALPFVVVAIFLSLSIIPVAIYNRKITRTHEIELINIHALTKIAASSIFTCFVSGLILSSIYSLLPIIFDQITSKSDQTAYLMFITLFGGMIFQYPIGILSDSFDRRKVMIAVSIVIFTLSMLLVGVGYENFSFNQLAVIYFIIGGMSFTFYPVALSLICDNLKSSHIVSVSQGLSMVEGIGSIIGPIMAPPFIAYFGIKGLAIYFALIVLTLLLFLIYRIFKKERISHNHFVVGLHTTPVVAELDPRGEEYKDEAEKNNIH
ncbi:MAG: MFS transporter [Rickettsiales bacterium]